MIDLYKLFDSCCFCFVDSNEQNNDLNSFLANDNVSSIRVGSSNAYIIKAKNNIENLKRCVIHEEYDDCIQKQIVDVFRKYNDNIDFKDFIVINSIDDYLRAISIIRDKYRLFAINSWGVKEYKGVEKKRALKPINFYYRGISNYTWGLEPSALREQNGHARVEEKYYFREYYDHFYENIRGMRLIDILFAMQHYGLPTRLLDITQNPMVGLYMASRENPGKIGELIVFLVDEESIKPSNSFQVEINAALALLTNNEKYCLLSGILANSNANSFSEVKINSSFSKDEYDLFVDAYRKLVRNIRKFDPLFEDDIDLQLLLRSFVVRGNRTNPRMVAQDGSFIVSGLLPSCSYSLGELYTRGDRVDNYIRTSRNISPRLLVFNKGRLLKELDEIRISDEVLFPDKFIDSVRLRLGRSWPEKRQ